MAKAVFTIRASSGYDDIPEIRYHFPKQYLKIAEAARDDWIVYYEPRRDNGRQVYFAVAKISDIVPDPEHPDHFYAYISPRSYLELARPVPWRVGGFAYERGLLKSDGRPNRGLFGWAVRSLDDQAFAEILLAGLPDEAMLPDRESGVVETQSGLVEAGVEFAHKPRAIVEALVNRRERDRAFASAVKAAYNNTCAATGIRLINGGGRAEVEAAHIRPVKDDGPDSIRNGVALSGTVHWMFDRGLISIADDHRLLISKKHVPEPVRALFRPDGKLYVPAQPAFRPHPQFLSYHRVHYYKG